MSLASGYLRFIGINSSRRESTGACRDTANETAHASRRRLRAGTTPAVETVTRRCASPYPLWSVMILRAGKTASVLSRGSPIPIMTTLPTVRPSFCVASRRLAVRSCVRISAVVRFRENPCSPVRQKRQARAQPTCEEMHKVVRRASGIITASIRLRAPTSKSSFCTPSRAGTHSANGNSSNTPVRRTSSRRGLGKSFKLSPVSPRPPFLCSRSKTWRPR